jgi:translation initiation factor 5
MATQMLPVKAGEDVRTYRYLMPKLLLRSSARSTEVLNAAAVCHDLLRTPFCLRQWFALCLSTTATLDESASEIQIRGGHDAQKMQAAVYEFIDVFVLCPSCANPETLMRAKGSVLELQCRACGAASRVQPGKNKAAQKMVPWILKNIQGKVLQPHAVVDRPIESLADVYVQRDLF